MRVEVTRSFLLVSSQERFPSLFGGVLGTHREPNLSTESMLHRSTGSHVQAPLRIEVVLGPEITQRSRSSGRLGCLSTTRFGVDSSHSKARS